MPVFKLPVRVYYEDTDAGGVVYHARYLHFFERARTEYLRTLNFSQQNLLNERKVAFVVKSIRIDYCVPAKLDDLLIVETYVVAIKGASIVFSQILKRDDEIISQAVVKVASVDLVKMRPVAIPQEIKAEIKLNDNIFGVMS
ncbi:tol-pal system-associated acyl-CoA thioesterase [Histophilus somni]|uniref:Tol-pal system-associated acyl-CoA thioesterase n=1 Tax=Histophilus somni TaxID=731 RepID=A0A9Q6Z1C4_HISSO|nr:tol-pal system-associated acyl-CoA thioesterase [Histophilus somni]ARU64259.1 tol-pal system-associated acyl-CoA thioesterase [Histophilus somni]ARU66044.1 tol-pal system-associated acyl-CoA thioesterase [Histophilus somni]ARU67917.1 tol-pal system-associated acyl-CoA thioesterase [Histophilus somni]ARU69796.1 tol-pal system-associated acyl-CoA thioesterase [Histophilus somni]ARU71673.1 tol-pal system-associated acyl-CoA thioesterase [Histophilus somni]